MVKVFFSGQSLLENSYISNAMKSGMEVDSVSVFGNFSGARISAFPQAVDYCRKVLLMTALKESDTPLTLDADWERQLDVLYRTDKKSRNVMKAFVHKIDEDALELYLIAAFEGLLRNEGNGLEDCGKCFVEILSISPLSVVGRISGRAAELSQGIRSNNVATRILAAQAFGILAAHPDTGSQIVLELIQGLLDDVKLWSTAVGAEANTVHGSMYALGNILSHVSLYARTELMGQRATEEAIIAILEILAGAKDASIKEAVFNAISQISALGALTPALIAKSSLDEDSMIQLLAVEAKKGNEKAITALGRLSLIFDADLNPKAEEHLTLITKTLYELFELKQAEVHFTVGEALTCVSACWESEALLLNLDVDVPYKGRVKRSNILDSMLGKLLKDCKTTKPSLKKASGIWLFSLIQNCGHTSEVQSRLREGQGAFMGLLSARDELVQETASRGLSLVYEQGDAELKEKLVKDLVASFTGTSAQLKVDEETELFEPGALPTGEGKSVTSYKDIISLANEVGDQSLVYKFMSLASNAATWSTRSAFGRFGLSNILSSSEVDPKLYPKLYRYRFDPNPNVRRSMNDIWNSLVKDSSATVNEHFDDILADLLKSIVGKEWRTREASCDAIADLIQGREFDKYEKHLHDIWHVAFKVMDDIKGSVRAKALSLSMALTGILVRQVEAGTESRHAQAMLKEVLPFLLSGQGIESSAKDVQAFATMTVLKLIKKGGKALRPFIPSLVEQLLGLLSTMEMEGVDYLYLRAAQYDLTEEKIDTARSNAVTQSPLMESIERCLDQLDDETMAKLVPHLENVIRTTVGMPSKIGCSAVLVSLATRHSFVFKPHADTFLKIVEKTVLDRNNAVSTAYARSAGYMSRLGSDDSLLRLAKYSKSLYFNAEDEAKRQVAADTIYAVSKFASDRFNSMSTEYLPFVFLAKHDFDEHVKDQFEKTWSENVGGSRAVLLYLREITSLCAERLESPKWVIKHTAAMTIADVVQSSGADISEPNAAIIWPALEKSLALKTFDGKEKVLEAFVKFAEAGSSLWEKEPTIAAQMKKIAIREAKRNNDSYRPHAFISLGKYSETQKDLDMFNEAYDIIAPILVDFASDDKMDTTDDSKSGGTSDEASTITAGVAALFRAVNITSVNPSPLTHLPKLLELIEKLLPSEKITVATRLNLYERIKVLFNGLTKRTHSQGSNLYSLALSYLVLLELHSGSGSEVMRTKRAEAAETIIQAIAGGVFGNSEEGRAICEGRMKELILEGKKHERSPTVQAALDKALRALKE